MKRLALVTCVLMGATLAACTNSPTAPASHPATGSISANYGVGAAYQIEITSNLTGKTGGGIWLWIELTPSFPGATTGTGDYTGSDCGRGAAAHAVADAGDVTWSASGGTITITGVTLNGFGGLPVTVTVPSTYGHESTDVVSVFPTLAGFPLYLPSGAGFSQVQVAR